MALVYFELNPEAKVEGKEQQPLPLSGQNATCVTSALLSCPIKEKRTEKEPEIISAEEGHSPDKNQTTNPLWNLKNDHPRNKAEC
jgi:hypothetical protein